MKLAERIFHSVLFEIGAVAVATVAVLAVGKGIDTGAAVGTGVVMSLIAMVWNLIFNYFLTNASQANAKNEVWFYA